MTSWTLLIRFYLWSKYSINLIKRIHWRTSSKNQTLCGSNVFQDYFDDAKYSSQESKVKQVSRIKESSNQSKFQESNSRSIKNQDSSKESREDSIKISIKRVFQNIESWLNDSLILETCFDWTTL